MRPILSILGPTGVGKTALSLEVAKRVGGEIVSCDSRQIYRPLTIGTAKPSRAELQLVPHHFINEFDLDEPYSAGIFTNRAEDRIDQIVARGSVPIVVGGSTLYAEALLHGLSKVPPTTEATRARLMERLRLGEAQSLYDELLRVDPQTANTLDPTRTQRVVRALEVVIDTGKPLSYHHENKELPRFSYDPVVLTRPRETLYARINARVDEMIERGLIDEAESILAEGYSPALNALRTIGYREPIAFLRGDLSREAMVDRLKRNSRRYAKRQLTWYRRRASYRWLDLSGQSTQKLLDIVMQ